MAGGGDGVGHSEDDDDIDVSDGSDEVTVVGVVGLLPWLWFCWSLSLLSAMMVTFFFLSGVVPGELCAVQIVELDGGTFPCCCCCSSVEEDSLRSESI